MRARKFSLPPVYWRRHVGPFPARYAMAAELRQALHRSRLLHRLMRERDAARAAHDAVAGRFNDLAVENAAAMRQLAETRAALLNCVRRSNNCHIPPGATRTTENPPQQCDGWDAEQCGCAIEARGMLGETAKTRQEEGQ